MAFAVSIIKAENFEKWMASFNTEESVAARKTTGETSHRLFRSVDNPNTIVALWEWDSHENLRKFALSDELREAMKESGVIGIPVTYYLDEVEQGAL